MASLFAISENTPWLRLAKHGTPSNYLFSVDGEICVAQPERYLGAVLFKEVIPSDVLGMSGMQD
jgi:hypothetical protein